MSAKSRLPRITLKVRATFDPGQRLARVSRSGSGWLVGLHDSGETILLDAELREVRRVPLGTGSDKYVLPMGATSPNGGMFAVSQRERACVFDAEARLVHEWPHAPWDSFSNGAASFSSDGKLLWVVKPAQSRSATLVLVRVGSWETIAEAPLDSHAGSHAIYANPRVDRIVVESAEGQDGPRNWVAGEKRGRIDLVELFEGEDHDRVFGSFNPDGSEFVTASHHRGDGIAIHEFPSGRVLGRIAHAVPELIEAHAADFAEDEFGYGSRFLSATRLLLDTMTGRLLMADRKSLALVAEVLPEGYRVQGYDGRGKPTSVLDEIDQFESDVSGYQLAGADELLTTYRQRALHLCALPPERPSRSKPRRRS